MHAYLCTTCVPGGSRGLKTVSGILNEHGPTHMFAYLVPSWLNYLGRFRRWGLVGGGTSPGLDFQFSRCSSHSKLAFCLVHMSLTMFLPAYLCPPSWTLSEIGSLIKFFVLWMALFIVFWHSNVTGFTDGFELPGRCWESKWSPLGKQKIFPTLSNHASPFLCGLYQVSSTLSLTFVLLSGKF